MVTKENVRAKDGKQVHCRSMTQKLLFTSKTVERSTGLHTIFKFFTSFFDKKNRFEVFQRQLSDSTKLDLMLSPIIWEQMPP